MQATLAVVGYLLGLSYAVRSALGAAATVMCVWAMN
jgi:hypothetical protein